MIKVGNEGWVTFSVKADGCHEVCVAGDFNDWNPTATKMPCSEKYGVFALAVKLPKGTHQYKFVIDGVWCADPENESAIMNDQGSFNSLVEVV